MKRAWIKLFIEILDDPKMGRMPDWLWKRAIELFLLAGENGDDGLLQPVDDMAWRLRTSPEKLTESLQALSQVGVVYESPQGWRVTNFDKRQAALTVSERVSAYRERKKAEGVTKSYIDDNEVEVSVSSSTSSSDSSSDSVSSEGGGVGEGEVFSAYESNIGMLSPKIADGLKADIDDYSVAWVMAAIDYAVRQEKRSLAYVEGVLKGWKRDGLTNPPPARAKDTHADGPKNANGKPPAEPPQFDSIRRWVEKKTQEQTRG